MTDPTKPPPKHNPNGYYGRADWFEARCVALEAELAQAQARVTELSEMKPATMRQALLLLTNGMKYSTEVVTIAREAVRQK